MKFGKVSDISGIDFSLPNDAFDASLFRVEMNTATDMEVYVGCAKWNRTDLKNFYPRGTKDELEYYSRQFNSIELNATFYNMPTIAQVQKWKNKTPDGFKFFPKITNSISHYRRLLNVKPLVDEYCDAIAHFEEKLGMVFLQLNENFSPNEFEKLKILVENFPKIIPLSVEVRNEKWFADKNVWTEYCRLLEENNITNLITDSAGRRDMLHMHLTTRTAFIRFNGCNVDAVDYKRMDDWIHRIEQWKMQGINRFYFFVHQNMEISSPLLSAYFIKKMNECFHLRMKLPSLQYENLSLSLF